MTTQKFTDIQLMRYRAMSVSLGTSGNVNWDPFNEGSLLNVNVTGPAVTTTLLFTVPSVSGLTDPSGLVIHVAVATNGSGTDALVIWPAAFKFQTAGDAIPNALANSVTIWKGLVLPGSSGNIYMTKLGEWTGI